VAKYCRFIDLILFFNLWECFILLLVIWQFFHLLNSSAVLQGVSYGSGPSQSTAVCFLTVSCRGYTNIVLTGGLESLFSRWGELRLPRPY